MDVNGVVAALRHSPRHAALPSVFDLPLHGCCASLIEQGILVGRHHQQRHQVLEHRAAPRQQDRVTAYSGQQTPEGEPTLLRQFALRNGDEIAQTHFRCQQIVVARIAAALRDVVSDHQLTPHFVIQEVVVHCGQCARQQRELIDSDHARLRAGGTLRHERLQLIERGPLLRSRAFVARAAAGR